MPFPKTERVIYAKSPLGEVICQLRFPPILRIDSDVPSTFQDQIRQDYPYYEVRLQENVLPAELRERLPKEVVELFTSETRSKVHDFISEDRGWRLGLAKDFLSLATPSYSRWAEFRERLAKPIDTLVREYAPAFYLRIGLRYRNIICRSHIGMSDIPWSQLLQPHIAAPLNAANLDDGSVTDVAHRIEVKLKDEQGQVRLIHGFLRIDGEVCYIIDNDLFTEQKTGVQDALGKLDYFNGYAGRIFRWCI
ncbi:MAG: TIGR04255 family protein, partial [Caldilineaceae bacterium]|nr:TIGR04255 family protein [Caldilineaceae bacterium]